MGALSERIDENTEIFYSEIHTALYDFINDPDRHIDDMRKESQSIWNAALIYIYNTVFKGTDKLKLKSQLLNYNNNRNGLNNSNCNAYNYDLVNSICDYYIALCYEYDKEISILGFSKLTGIDSSSIQEWGANINKLSSTAFEIYKKLHKERQESLTNKLVSGNKNPVGVLGILNHFYGWNMPGVSREQTQKRVLTAAELPKLGDYSSNCTIENSTEIGLKEPESQ